MTGTQRRRAGSARWTAAVSRPALELASEQCGTTLDELDEWVMFRRWQEQWGQAPTFVRLGVLGAWSFVGIVRAVLALVRRREAAQPAIVNAIVEASVRVARFEVANRLTELRER